MGDIFDQLHLESQGAQSGDIFDKLHAAGGQPSPVNPKSPAEVGAYLKNRYPGAYQDQPSVTRQVLTGAAKQAGRDVYEFGRSAVNAADALVSPYGAVKELIQGHPEPPSKLTQNVQAATEPKGPGEEAGSLFTTGAELATSVPKMVTGAARGLGKLVQANPRVAIGRALRPTPSQAGFTERIPETLRAIKAANPGYAPAMENGALNLSDAAQQAIDVHQAALEPWIQRARGTTISGEPIVRATAEATRGMLPSEGASAQSLIARAQQDYGNFTPEELRARLALLNERLSPFYNKSQAAQSSALADIPEAVLKAQRDAVAETLYRHLDPEGGGAGPRLIQSKTGDLIDLLKASQRRNEAIGAEQPLTPLGRIIDPLKGAIRGMMPGKATGSGIAFAEGSEGRSLPLIKRAFKSVGDEQPNVLPQPGTPFYPNAPASRQLGPGPTQMPSGPDTSSVRGVPAQPAQSQFRKLPAPPPVREMPPVPDTSGDRSWTGPQGPPSPYRQIESGPKPPPQRVSPSGGTVVTPPVDPSGVKLTPARKIVDPETGKIYYVAEPENQVGPRKPNPGAPEMARGGVVVPKSKQKVRISKRGIAYGSPQALREMGPPRPQMKPEVGPPRPV